MKSREIYWTDIVPECWEQKGQKKQFSIGRLHIEMTPDKKGKPVKKVTLLYPSRNKFPGGYATSYQKLFPANVREINRAPNGQAEAGHKKTISHREQVEKFPRQNDKYFLCKKVGCTTTTGGRTVSISDSEASIYMLTGGDLRKLSLEEAQKMESGWFNQHVTPYLVKTGSQWYTKLEKIVGGKYAVAVESVNPANIRIYYAPHAVNGAIRVVVTRADRPYFIVKADGCEFDASPSALALVAPKRPRKKATEPEAKQAEVAAPA